MGSRDGLKALLVEEYYLFADRDGSLHAHSQWLESDQNDHPVPHIE